MATLGCLAQYALSLIATFVAALVIKNLFNVVHCHQTLLSRHDQGGLWGDWVGNSCAVEVHFGVLCSHGVWHFDVAGGNG